MEHDIILKKLNFDFFSFFFGGGGGVCGQNIFYHVVALVILFNLICNMNMF